MQTLFPKLPWLHKAAIYSHWQGQQPESVFRSICFFANCMTVFEVLLVWRKCFVRFHLPGCPQGLRLAVSHNLGIYKWWAGSFVINRGALPSVVPRGLSLGIQRGHLDFNCTFPTAGKEGEKCHGCFSRECHTGRGSRHSLFPTAHITALYSGIDCLAVQWTVTSLLEN